MPNHDIMTGKTAVAVTPKSLATILAAFGAIQTSILVPLIRAESRDIVDSAMEKHASVPHRGVATRQEVQLELGRILDQLNRIDDKLERQLGRK